MNGLDVLLLGQRARDAVFSWLASTGFESFGARSRILLPFRVGNGDRIAIGSDVLIGPGSWLIVPRLDHPGPNIRIEIGRAHV